MQNLISVTQVTSKQQEYLILDASQSNDDNIQIKGARAFDIKNEFSNTESHFPNTFPSAGKFQESCRQLGINKDSKLVVYDNKGIFSSPRVWWMFKTFGHENIAVLDGGLPEWIRQGGEIESTKKMQFERGNFEASLRLNQVKIIEDIQSNIISKKCNVIDARSQDRFNGKMPETREGLRSGNIPNSINLPYANLLEDGKFKSKEEIKVHFHKLNLNDNPIIFTCGSGITACILLLGYQLAFEKEATIYDGSWTEWGTLVK